jgi:hypothetical protein
VLHLKVRADYIRSFQLEPFVFSSSAKNVNSKLYKCIHIFFPVVLYGCRTWSVTLREEHTLRVYENRVLRRIFGPHRVEMVGDWIT